MSINLSPHEKKILSLVDKYPSIIDDPLERKRVAELNGMSEKTLRNRLADLKRYGIIGNKNRIPNYNVSHDDGTLGSFILFWKSRIFILKNVIIVTLSAIIISLLLPKWYASKAVVLSSGAGQFNFLSSISPIPVADFGLSTINEAVSYTHLTLPTKA